MIHHRAPSRIVACAAAAALLLAGCGDDDDVSVEATTTTTTTSATTSTGPDGYPGERIDIYPYEGTELGVVGVAADDTLNVRGGPGTDFEVVTELAPTATGLVATGHNRDLGDSFWSQVSVDGTEGWANVRYLAVLGVTDDITAEVVAGGRPEAETMVELGQIVARTQATEEPESDIVVVAGPTVGDLGDITVDVIGLGDDAVAGYRLHVVGEPAPGGEGFVLRTVERTHLCARGGEPGGLCP